MSEMTLCEKVLARASGKDSVTPGEVIEAKPDVAMSHDNTYLVYRSFVDTGATEISDPGSIAVVLDHRAPASTVNAADSQKEIRRIVKEFGIGRFFDVGSGICHQLLVEDGIVQPGMLVIGSDSHSTTYGAVGAIGIGIGAMDMASIWVKGSLWLKVPESIRLEIAGAPRLGVYAKDIALKMVSELGPMGADYRCIEFHGSYFSTSNLSERMTLCNMAAEAGAKCATVPSRFFKNEVTHSDSKSVRACELPDDKAEYGRELSIEAGALEPLVALPSLVSNCAPVSSVEGEPIDQAFLGTCANGRLDDLMIASSILKGRRISGGVRLIVTPASREIYLSAMKNGIIETLIDAGAVVTNPGCGPCMGAHQGLLADGEVCISSGNRNFRGRMGSSEARIYLASPATVAASAIEGKIADPRRYLR